MNLTYQGIQNYRYKYLATNTPSNSQITDRFLFDMSSPANMPPQAQKYGQFYAQDKEKEREQDIPQQRRRCLLVWIATFERKKSRTGVYRKSRGNELIRYRKRVERA